MMFLWVVVAFAGLWFFVDRVTRNNPARIAHEERLKNRDSSASTSGDSGGWGGEDYADGDDDGGDSGDSGGDSGGDGGGD